ncbi:hypothetical protein Pmi06nite_16880 [Planotetraspora mira]|uniref:Uncharacterized protein n=1 Tax=Planotetraspora mira TaxID=58121 RepID=A0A8J3TM03_9ACTN|nr:hypothetical protein Pmi06nite_16880 [Planotetraspora mira]
MASPNETGPIHPKRCTGVTVVGLLSTVTRNLCNAVRQSSPGGSAEAAPVGEVGCADDCEVLCSM